ncbi:glycosyltransferase 61 family protein [Paracoccus marinaquae]|uniref:Glycosyltransferase family 61 protein n=1 Tax=Paracoccus marinaquae TaxID=2841926 RepID=A0ABS6AEZ9_9RHOB|nr:glycosyltransferase family 61 protein [Paracoccus marinaquae]MBU3029180.1 glycosyltransferase family 61 protein [Paracoccus marinaquae]
MFHSLRAFTSRLRQLAGLSGSDFFAGAEDRWQVAPAETMQYRRSLVLPGQVERIRASIFAPLPETLHALVEEEVCEEGPTMAWRLREVDLVDGVLYHGGAEYHLRARERRFGLTPRPESRISGALYEDWSANRWFGSWLMDACVAYDLAEAAGRPVSGAASPVGSHKARYEDLLGMSPERVEGDVHFTELVMFDDFANNSHRARRQDALRCRLLEGRSPRPVAGVFLLRGSAGEARLLENELDLAEALVAERGFLAIDPLEASVDELIEACGAAAAIVGVEGSHLVHGMMVAPKDAAIVPIQPPDRVAATLKQLANRLDQRFGLLVAEGGDGSFRLERDELMATLDLFGRDAPPARFA